MNAYFVFRLINLLLGLALGATAIYCFVAYYLWAKVIINLRGVAALFILVVTFEAIGIGFLK